MKRNEMESDSVGAYWLSLERNECYDKYAIYTVEIPKKLHNDPEIVKAKQKIIE